MYLNCFLVPKATRKSALIFSASASTPTSIFPRSLRALGVICNQYKESYLLRVIISSHVHKPHGDRQAEKPTKRTEKPKTIGPNLRLLAMAAVYKSLGSRF